VSSICTFVLIRALAYTVEPTCVHVRTSFEPEFASLSSGTTPCEQGEGADGEYEDQEPTSDNGYECCWKAPNPLLARCSAFRVAKEVPARV